MSVNTGWHCCCSGLHNASCLHIKCRGETTCCAASQCIVIRIVVFILFCFSKCHPNQSQSDVLYNTEHQLQQESFPLPPTKRGHQTLPLRDLWEQAKYQQHIHTRRHTSCQSPESLLSSAVCWPLYQACMLQIVS